MMETDIHAVNPAHRWFVRDLGAANLLENFLITAVAAILLIRLGLQLTGYPQIGGGGLHIAHMLWGGLGMLVAIIIMLEFTNHTAREWAAIIGGFGFGAFIDELGKFITSDNNYFFQPTIAAIYVIFVLLFLSVRWLNRPRSLSAEEALDNAAEIIRKGIHTGGLSDTDRQVARGLIERSNPGEHLAIALRRILDKVESSPQRPPHTLIRLRRALTSFYTGLVSRGWFQWLVIGVFLASAVFDLAWIMLGMDWTWLTLAVILGGGLALWALLQFTGNNTLRSRLLRWSLGTVLVIVMALDVLMSAPGTLDSFNDGLEFMTGAATAVLTVIGAVIMRRSRFKAYQWFRRATLISILITEVLMFYQYQFIALGSLAFDLLLLLALRYMIAQEIARSSPS
jgi:hypothetical protein